MRVAVRVGRLRVADILLCCYASSGVGCRRGASGRTRRRGGSPLRVCSGAHACVRGLRVLYGGGRKFVFFSVEPRFLGEGFSRGSGFLRSGAVLIGACLMRWLQPWTHVVGRCVTSQCMHILGSAHSSGTPQRVPSASAGERQRKMNVATIIVYLMVTKLGSPPSGGAL